MASKAIYEADAKSLIYKYVKNNGLVQNNLFRINENTEISTILGQGLNWLESEVCPNNAPIFSHMHYLMLLLLTNPKTLAGITNS